MPIKKLKADLAALLPHLNASTARQHVFFQSVDSAFVGLAEQGGAPWIPPESIVFHLGDDFYYYGRIKQFTPIVRKPRRQRAPKPGSEDALPAWQRGRVALRLIYRSTRR